MGDRHVKFDEAVIAEHDKLRGTRQKIDEPDTPFHREASGASAGEDDVASGAEFLAGVAKDVEVVFQDGKGVVGQVPNSANVGELNAELASGFNAADLQAKLSGMQEDEKAAKPIAAKMKEQKDFDAHRKKHYNEYEMMLKWRQEHPDTDEEDEED